MEYLIHALDGVVGEHQPPRITPLPKTFDQGIVREALTYLRRTSLPLERAVNGRAADCSK